MRYYLIAGEASGDLHASNLMQSLKNRDPKAEFRYFGGDLMQAKGGTLVKHYREMAFMGIIPVIMNAGTILRNLSFCKNDIKSYNPDAIILIDYPSFNLKIAKYVKESLGIPVYYYISPKVWAWKEYRVKLFKKYVDKMLCILPFEVDFYKKHSYPVYYVGNPTLDAVASRSFQDESFEEFTTTNQLERRPIIALLAGSRKREISQNLPTMLVAAKDLDEYQIVIAGAPGIDKEFYSEYLQDVNATILFGQTYRILQQSEVALVTSGTATLETALLNVPQVVCYKTALPRLSYWSFKNILHTPYISLVNLICNREVVLELFAKFFSIENIKLELHRLLFDKKYRQKMLDGYEELHNLIGKPGASERAAEIIFNSLSSDNTG